MDMRRKQVDVPISSVISRVRVLVQLAREHCIDEVSCLSSSGIAVADFIKTHTRLSMDQEFAVIRYLQARLGGNGGFGLDAGLRYRSTTLGILGYAIASSATFREAIEVALRYLNPMYGCLFLCCEEQGDEIRLIVDDTLAPADIRQFLVEQTIAALYSLSREISGLPGAKLPVGQVMLRFPRPAYAERFSVLGSRSIVFDAPCNAIVADRAILNLPLPNRNDATKEFCLSQYADQLSFENFRERLKVFIRKHLQQPPGRMPTMEEMAASFAMTARTLRRRLEDEGTSYRQLIGEVLLSQANELLRAGSPVDIVASRLGFSEAASFIRAYKRWTGRTPGRRRKSTE